MKRVFGNCLLALGLFSLAMLIWFTPVSVRTSEGQIVPASTTNWAGLIVPVAIIVAMIWGGVALRRSGRPSS